MIRKKSLRTSRSTRRRDGFWSVTGYPRLKAAALGLALALLAGPDAAVSGEEGLAAIYSQARKLMEAGDLGKAREALGPLAAHSFILGDYAALDLARTMIKSGDPSGALPVLARLIKDFPASPLRYRANELRVRLACEDVSSDICGKTLKSVGVSGVSAEFRPRRLFIEARRLESLGGKRAAFKMYQRVYYSYPDQALDGKIRGATSKLRQEENAPAGKSVYPYAAFSQRMERAGKLIRAFRYSEAAVDLEGILEIGYSESRKAQALFMLGEARGKERDRGLAKKTFEEFISRYPGHRLSHQASYNIAVMDWNMDNNEQCASRLEELLGSKAAPEIKASSLLVLGRIAESKNDYDAARRRYSSAIDLGPDGNMAYELHWRLGWIEYQSGDYPAAAKVFSSAAEDASQRLRDGKFLYWAAKSYAMANLPEAAEGSMKTLKKIFPHTYYGTLAASGGKTGHLGVNGYEAVVFPAASIAKPSGLRLSAQAGRIHERYMALAGIEMFSEAGMEVDALARHVPGKPENILWLGMLYRQARAAAKSIRLQAGNMAAVDNVSDFTDPFWKAYYPVAYWDTVLNEAKSHSVDPFLALAIIRQESAFNDGALSPANARGLMQLIPATGERVYNKIEMGRRTGKPFISDLLFDPYINIPLGVAHFSELLARYEGDLTLALAAYNAGMKTADRWKERFAPMPDDEFVEMIPYSETREYVKRIKRNMALYHFIYGNYVNAGTQDGECSVC